ncbi:phosphotriesterase [Citrobacter sp. MH181794]|nr:phosphotriesterase [Citrobacter sp. MH181794]
MSDFNLWGWDKKPRTMLRFIKPGDIFSFTLDDEKYCFGRIISRFDIGDVAEIFSFISDKPSISVDDIYKSTRLIPPLILNTYSLFDKKREKNSDWRIIGNQKNYIPNNVDDIYFTYGVDRWCKKVDIFGNETSISAEEAKNISDLSPNNDYDVKQLINSFPNKTNNI